MDSPAPPWVYIFLGAVISGFGALVFTNAEQGPLVAVGIGLAWLGSVLTLAGTVALGVQVGSTRAEWKRRKTGR